MSDPTIFEISKHATEAEAEKAGHSLLRLTGGLPVGWAVAILGSDEEGWTLVRYEV